MKLIVCLEIEQILRQYFYWPRLRQTLVFNTDTAFFSYLAPILNAFYYTLSEY
jgi:hypothetical protein